MKDVACEQAFGRAIFPQTESLFTGYEGWSNGARLLKQ